MRLVYPIKIENSIVNFSHNVTLLGEKKVVDSPKIRVYTNINLIIKEMWEKSLVHSPLFLLTTD